MKSLGTVTLYTTRRLIEVCLLLKGKVNCFSLWQINFNGICCYAHVILAVV